MAISRYGMPVTYGSPGATIVSMRGIHKVFHTGAGEYSVLKGIDVDLCQGEFVSVIGRSGSGKSTLVNMLTGIDHPSSGTVDVGSVRINNMPESRMAVWRGKNLGIVFQFFQLLPMLTLVENVMLPMDFCNIYPPASREGRAMDLLKRVGLERLAHKLPGAVAGGQQQSAAVARALANDPPILIADEPTGNLDSVTAENVLGIFEELVAQGKTVLMVTHDRELAKRAQRTLLISDGELVNEILVAAFPNLQHSQLLQLSRLSVPVELSPGATLPEPVTPAATPIYLVTAGELQCRRDVSACRLGPGSLLDPLTRLGESFQACEQGARMLALPRDVLQPVPPVLPSVRKETDTPVASMRRSFFPFGKRSSRREP